MSLADFLTFMIMIFVVFTLVSTISGEFDKIEEGCSNSSIFSTVNSSTMGCEMLSEGSPIGLLFRSKLILFTLMALPIWMVFGRTISRLLRGIMIGIGEFMDDMLVSNISSIDIKDNEKEQYLKETKDKLKKELNQNKSKPARDDRGVSWGSGVDLGEGIDEYSKMKGGDR